LLWVIEEMFYLQWVHYKF